MKKKPSARSRPLSKTQGKRPQLKCVEHYPPSCPDCGCTDRSNLGRVIKHALTGDGVVKVVSPPRDVEDDISPAPTYGGALIKPISGYTPVKRVQYSRVAWAYCCCLGCGKRYRIKAYLKPSFRKHGNKGLLDNKDAS